LCILAGYHLEWSVVDEGHKTWELMGRMEELDPLATMVLILSNPRTAVPSMYVEIPKRGVSRQF
jgi:hypothetical protein